MKKTVGKVETKMKVIGFNGSPRKDGNTFILINHVFRELEKEGMETELVQLSEKEIHGCIACYKCFENKDQRCAVKTDAANEYIEKIINTDSMNHFLLSQQIFIVGRAVGVGREKGEAEKDEEGVQLAKSLGQRMGWLLKKLYG